jgi:hypothetical protein
MSILRPEQSVDRALTRPAAYAAGSRWTDGTPLDAGTAILAMSEASTLIGESARHLVASLGPGAQTICFGSEDGPWEGIAGLVAPAKTAGVFDGPSKIPWDRRTAARFEGGAVLEDRLSAQGDPLPRRVRFAARIRVSGVITSAQAFFALTYSPSPRACLGCSAADGTFAEVALTPGSEQWAEATLAPVRRAPSALERWRARANASLGMYAAVTPQWLWFGWRFLGSNDGGTKVLSLSAFEAP